MCQKCWDRFDKTFSSSLASSLWDDQGDSAPSKSLHDRMLRPLLPVIKPQQAGSAPVHPHPATLSAHATSSAPAARHFIQV